MTFERRVPRVRVAVWVVSALAGLSGCAADAGSGAPARTTSGVAGSSSAGQGGAGPAATGIGGSNGPGSGGAGGEVTASDGSAMDTAAGTGGESVSTSDGAAPDASRDAATVGDGGGVVITDPGNAGDGDSMIASPFRTAPEYTVAAGVKRGQIVRFTMNGMTSTIYRGAYMRNAAVYIPAGYVSGTEIPFMVAQDGLQFGYLNNIVPVLDNFIASGKLPAMAVVAADPSNQRSVEYDTVSDTFVRFVEAELLPEAKKQVKAMANVDLNLTEDPEGRASYGGSSGGSCAFVMGWFGNYRRILTVSGSFVALQTSAMYPRRAAQFANGLIASTTPLKPLRAFLEACSNDLGDCNGAN